MVGGGRALGAGAVEEQDPAAGLQSACDPLPEGVEAILGHVREPEGEEADVVGARLGRPLEQVGLDVAHRRLTDPRLADPRLTDPALANARPVDRQHLRGAIDGGHPVGEADQMARPQAGPTRQLEHPPARREALEDGLELGHLREPGGVGLGAAVKAALPQPPGVVLARPGTVVVELLSQQRVVDHAAQRVRRR